MTFKYLNGAYPGGYTLSASYSGLVVEVTASVGGTGVLANFSTTVLNLGEVNANGSNVGVRLSAGGALTNGDAGHTAALIEGFSGVTGGGATSLANYGTIAGDTGIGVQLSAGGRVTNGSVGDEAASVSGGVNGVQITGDATVVNFGMIRGQIGFGVALVSGGTVINGSAADTAALIAGYNAGVLTQGVATVVNFGTIEGAPFYGVRLTAGGTLTNGSAGDTGAVISGQLGVLAAGAATVVNYGTISGGGGAAVQFTSSAGILEVQAGCVFQGAIQGDAGTLDLASGAGTITSLAGGSVTVTGSMPITTFTNFGTVEIAAGARFTVAATGTIGGGATDTLIDDGLLALEGGAAFGGTFELASGAVLQLVPQSGGKVVFGGNSNLAGTLQGKGVLRLTAAQIGAFAMSGKVSLVDAGSVEQTGAITRGAVSKSSDAITVVKGATWTIENDAGIALPNLQVSGELVKMGGTGTSLISAATTVDGSLVAASGSLEVSRNVAGSGALTVDGGATLEIDGGAASTLSTVFQSAGGALALGRAAAFAATLSGFVPGDVIDLLSQKATAAVLGPGNTLVITNGSRAVATLQLSGNYAGDTFSVAKDGNGGTDITVSSVGAREPPGVPAQRAHVFAAAAAALGPERCFGSAHPGEDRPTPAPLLARPTA